MVVHGVEDVLFASPFRLGAQSQWHIHFRSRKPEYHTRIAGLGAHRTATCMCNFCYDSRRQDDCTSPHTYFLLGGYAHVAPTGAMLRWTVLRTDFKRLISPAIASPIAQVRPDPARGGCCRLAVRPTVRCGVRRRQCGREW